MYLDGFANKKDVFQEFSHGWETVDEDLKDWYKNCKVLFAWYLYEDYDGSAFVLVERDGVLYEVNGGHCSCYGLEGQWDPEETSVDVLKHRMENGTLGYYFNGDYAKKLKGVLYRWQRKQSA